MVKSYFQRQLFTSLSHCD